MSRVQLAHTYDDIISLDNLLGAWQGFLPGKRCRHDVQLFERRLMPNLIALHRDLSAGGYQHGPYQAFTVTDPKPRSIHKASVRDRILHHAVYRILYPFFDRTFIADSFSCRNGRGTHKALDRFHQFARRASQNHTRTCWVLKCDIRKFFASIDQLILRGILATYIPDQSIRWLLDVIIGSFHSTQSGKGLPLGNLTSQLLVNIYMNEFDQYVKHQLKAKYYIRYADDFVILSERREWLHQQVPVSRNVLSRLLALSLHSGKVEINTAASGIDFLGWVHFPNHRVLRTVTARRARRKVRENPKQEVIQSYRGLLSHGDTYKLQARIFEAQDLIRSTGLTDWPGRGSIGP